MTTGRKFFIAAKLLCAALLWASNAFCAPLQLTVTSSVPSTKVLVYMSNTLISNYNTMVATTTAGSAVFSVDNGTTYNIVCSSQGYSPTMYYQFRNGPITEYMTADKTVACPALSADYSLSPATIAYSNAETFDSCYSAGCLIYSAVYNNTSKTAVAYDFHKIRSSDPERTFTIANVPDSSASETFIQSVVLDYEMMKETIIDTTLPLSAPYAINFSSATFGPPAVSGQVQNYSNATSLFDADVWVNTSPSGTKGESTYTRRSGPDGKYRMFSGPAYTLPTTPFYVSAGKTGFIQGSPQTVSDTPASGIYFSLQPEVTLTASSAVERTKVVLVPDTGNGMDMTGGTGIVVAYTVSGSTAIQVNDNTAYRVVCSSSGYSPSMQQQFLSGAPVVSISGSVTFSCPALTPNSNLKAVSLTVPSAPPSACSSGQCTLFTTAYSTSAKTAVAYDFHKISPNASASYTFDNLPAYSSASDIFLQMVILNSGDMKEKLLPCAPGYCSGLIMDFNSFQSPSIKGRVTNNGAPVENTAVWLGRKTDTPKTSPYMRRTAPDGAFRFLDDSNTYAMPALPFNLNISSDGFIPAQYYINTYPSAMGSLNLGRSSAYYLEGYFKKDGSGISNVLVQTGPDTHYWPGNDTYANTSLGMGVYTSTYTSADGSFRLNGLADGNVSLNFTYGGTTYIFNAGTDNNQATTWDNQRLTISNSYQYYNAVNNPPGTVYVYNSSGTIVSTGTLSYNLTTQTQATMPVRVRTYKNGALAPNVKTLLITHDPATGAVTSRSTIVFSNAEGLATFLAEPGTIFHTACEAEGYFPTLKDQLESNPRTLTEAVDTSCPITTGGDRINTLNQNVSGFSRYPCYYSSAGCTFFTTVYRTRNPENIVAMDLHKVSSYGQLQAFNLPNSPASELSAQILLLDENRAVTNTINFALPSGNGLSYDFTNAMPPGTTATTLSSASIAGVVKSGSMPVANAKVSLNKVGTNYSSNNYRYTDSNGSFIFEALESSAQYNLYVSSLGFSAANRFITALPWSETMEMESASYSLEGYVKYNGVPISGAEVNIWGDWNSWPGSDTYACSTGTFCSKAMSSNARATTDGAGRFIVNGLPDGNVSLYANLRGLSSNYNNGADGDSALTSDNRRITIVDDYTAFASTFVAPGTAIIYNYSGTALSSGPVVVNFSGTSSASTATIAGTITFNTAEIISASNKLVIPSTAPVTLMAVQDCRDSCSNMTLKMGLTSIHGEYASASVPYSMSVSSGYVYHLTLPSAEWAITTSFDRNADFTTGDSSTTLNLTLTKAGALRGQIKKPDGSIYMPNWGVETSTDTRWFEVKVDGVNIDYDEGTGMQEDGTYNFSNVAPGTYNVTLLPKGAGNYYPPIKKEKVMVSVGKTTEANFTLDNALAVQPVTGALPAISTESWSYSVIAMPASLSLNQKTITDLFFSDPMYSFTYSTATASWSTKWMAPGAYNFYLCLSTVFEPSSGKKSYDQFANFIGQLKNFTIDRSPSDALLGTASKPILLSISGTTGTASIGGTVVGENIFTDRDLEKIFMSGLPELEPLLPMVTVFNSEGEMRMVGHAMPSQAGFPGIEGALVQKDKDAFLSALERYPLKYYLYGLPAGNYTAVFTNPNYPSISKEVSLPANSSYNFDFDAQTTLSGAVYGVVVSSADGSTPLPNATVLLKHRSQDRKVTTGLDGSYRVSSLPTGTYRMELSRDGYVPQGTKVSVTNGKTLRKDFALVPTGAEISGNIYTTRVPQKSSREGIRIVAYNETLNTTDPTNYLPKYETMTDSNGHYSIPSVMDRSTYTLAAIYPGKLTEKALVYVSANAPQTAEDIFLTDSPPQFTVKIKKSPAQAGVLEIYIISPQSIDATPVCTYNTGSSYNAANATTVALTALPNHAYSGQFAYSSLVTAYTIKVTAGDAGNTLEKEMVYDPTSANRTEQYIYDTTITGGSIFMDDESQEYSGLEFDAGGLTYSSATSSSPQRAAYGQIRGREAIIGGFFSALPSVKIVKTNKEDSTTLETALRGLLASAIYDINLTNAQQNKPFSLNLQYAKEAVANTNAMRIYQKTSDGWVKVPGSYSIDPINGVISVEVSSLEEAYKEDTADTPLLMSRAYGAATISKQGYYARNASQPTTQTAQFAVFASAPASTVTYSGADFAVYNLPNPFNLKSKTITLSSDGSSVLGAGTYTTNGTLLKYLLPSGKSGEVKFAIYNLAGELVRTINEGNRDGGQIYYSEWDGKNDSGSNCASGVYFMLTFVDGKKTGGKALKMALIK